MADAIMYVCMYRLNRKGPSTDLCGTPQVTGEVWDMLLPTVVN